MNQLSIVQAERLFAAHASLEATRTQLEEIKGEWTETKKQRDERKEALLDAIKAAREAHSNAMVPRNEQESIFKLEKDFSRSDTAFELKDREKRRADDLEKKLAERIFSMLTEFREGEDLYPGTGLKGGDDKQAWQKVELADLIDNVMAGPFKAHGVFSVGDFLKAWGDTFDPLVKSKDLDGKLLEFAGAKVADFLRSRKIEKLIPSGMVDLVASLKKVADIAPIVEAKPEPQLALVGIDAVGEDEHLKATPHHLQLSANLTARLIANGFGTIGRLADMETKEDWSELSKDFTDNEVAGIRTAVQVYRLRHRAAMKAEDGKTPQPSPPKRAAKAPAKKRGKK